MPTVFDYLNWRGDVTLEEVPICEVDNLILCLLSYANLEGIVPPPSVRGSITVRRAAAEYFFRHKEAGAHPLGLIIPPDILRLLRAAAYAPRFRDLELTGYVNEVNENRYMQFCAMTVRLPHEELFVVFGGTDDSIAGWREDLNLSFMKEVPSQSRATRYLNDLDLTPDTRLYVGGHSKGGNLAVWGATHAGEAIRKAIRGVYSNDGPGFSTELLRSPAYTELKERLHIYLPDDSLVGLLLEHDEDYTVVRSNRRGLLQHDGLTWEIMGSRFRRAESLSPKGLRTDTVLRQRIDAMTGAEREQLIRIFFTVIESTGAKTLTDLADGKGSRAVSVLKALRSLSSEERKTALCLWNKLTGKRLPSPDPPPHQTPPLHGRVRVTVSPASGLIIRIF